MLKEADAAAEASGFCENATCTLNEVQAWAVTHGADSPSPLRNYSRALYPGPQPPQHQNSTSGEAALAVAKALERDPEMMRADAEALAAAAGGCASVFLCTQIELEVWAQKYLVNLTGPAKSYASALSANAQDTQVSHTMTLACLNASLSTHQASLSTFRSLCMP